jgi:hypothetical protein
VFKKKSPPQQIQCLNCGTTFSGWFCPECGQKSQTKRLTLFAVTKDFVDAVSDSDKGFLKTVLDLSQNPGQMLRNYISGKRQRYLSAGKYTFFLVILFTINISYLESHFGFFEKLTGLLEQSQVTQVGDNIHLTDKRTQQEIVKKNPSAVQVTDKKNNVRLNFEIFGEKVDKTATKAEFLSFMKMLIPKYHKSLFDSLKIFVILWIPIFSLFSFIFFRKSGYNFAEHMTINSYIYSQLLLIFILLSGFYWVFPEAVSSTILSTLAATTLYLFYSYMQIFTSKRYQLAKSFGAIAMGGITYMTALIALISVQLFYVALKNIDKL